MTMRFGNACRQHPRRLAFADPSRYKDPKGLNLSQMLQSSLSSLCDGAKRSHCLKAV